MNKKTIIIALTTAGQLVKKVRMKKKKINTQTYYSMLDKTIQNKLLAKMGVGKRHD